jgi:hypothetical protein
MLSSILFTAVAVLSIALAARQFLKVRRNILLGQPEEIGKVFAGFQKFLYAEKGS